uniref:Uncharacterized protein n=1 Tax=Strigamia maritima TaxID=126957 RepID=T1INY1_STRMM
MKDMRLKMDFNKIKCDYEFSLYMLFARLMIDCTLTPVSLTQFGFKSFMMPVYHSCKKFILETPYLDLCSLDERRRNIRCITLKISRAINVTAVRASTLLRPGSAFVFRSNIVDRHLRRISLRPLFDAIFDWIMEWNQRLTTKNLSTMRNTTNKASSLISISKGTMRNITKASASLMPISMRNTTMASSLIPISKVMKMGNTTKTSSLTTKASMKSSVATKTSISAKKSCMATKSSLSAKKSSVATKTSAKNSSVATKTSAKKSSVATKTSLSAKKSSAATKTSAKKLSVATKTSLSAKKSSVSLNTFSQLSQVTTTTVTTQISTVGLSALAGEKIVLKTKKLMITYCNDPSYSSACVSHIQFLLVSSLEV